MRSLLFLAPVLATVALPLTLLSACATATATLTPEQCAANWRAVGYADGREGEDADRFEAYRAACARGGAALSEADAANWADGWNEARANAPDLDAANARENRYDDDEDDGGMPYPRIYPRIGVGVGSGGVSVGGGVGIGLGVFSLGVGL